MNKATSFFCILTLTVCPSFAMQEKSDVGPQEKNKQTYWQTFSSRMPSWLTKKHVLVGSAMITSGVLLFARFAPRSHSGERPLPSITNDPITKTCNNILALNKEIGQEIARIKDVYESKRSSYRRQS